MIATWLLRTDWDQDGFIQGPEAWQLLERSRLDPHTLQQIFELADGRWMGLRMGRKMKEVPKSNFNTPREAVFFQTMISQFYMGYTHI